MTLNVAIFPNNYNFIRPNEKSNLCKQSIHVAE